MRQHSLKPIKALTTHERFLIRAEQGVLCVSTAINGGKLCSFHMVKLDEVILATLLSPLLLGLYYTTRGACEGYPDLLEGS
jgi:hypothetical protein